MTARTAYVVDRRTFARCYPGERGQPRLVRVVLALLLEGCPRADDAVLIASELAANAAVHSNSAAPGGQFTVRAEVYCGDYVWIEVGDAYDNALAETTIGLYKTECIRAGSPFRTGPLRTLADLEHITAAWVHWYNTSRLMHRLGRRPPADAEAAYRQQAAAQPDRAA